jgi:hypothetical protein
MRKKFKISQDEIFADIIFFCIAGFITFCLVFFFDIHPSFYNWPFALKFIFVNPNPYFVLVPIGTIVGFLLIKLLLYAFKREEHL